MMTTTPPRKRKTPITFPAPPVARAIAVRMPRVNDDLRLFAITFASGFLFTALFIA